MHRTHTSSGRDREFNGLESCIPQERFDVDGFIPLTAFELVSVSVIGSLLSSR